VFQNLVKISLDTASVEQSHKSHTHPTKAEFLTGFSGFDLKERLILINHMRMEDQYQLSTIQRQDPASNSPTHHELKKSKFFHSCFFAIIIQR